jgi:Tol biopolymer transport system component/DNA-binding winged helix-turn-helix (wHTH) protein
MGTNARRDLDDLGPNPALSVPRAAPSNPADTGPHHIPAAYSFLNLTLDMRRQLLVRGTDEIRLRSRSFDVLSYLVRNAGRLVAKQELMDAVWGDVAVTDDSLVQCLVEIRRELGEAEDRLKTVRGRGYLLDCEVHQEPPSDSNVRGEAPPSAAVAERPTAAPLESQVKRSAVAQISAHPLRIASGVLFVVFAVIAARFLLRPNMATGPVPTTVQFTISPPPGTAFGASGVGVNIETTAIALSPDGSQLAFVAMDPAGRSRIWLRPLATLEARSVPATDGATSVFWSPDSRSIAFFANGRLMRLDLSSGGVVTLCDVVQGTGLFGTWGSDGILFAAPEGHAIFRVPVAGGSPAKILGPDPSAGEISVGWPWFLPDGQRFLYLARSRDRDGHVKLAEPGKPPVTILSAVSNVQWVDPDYLVFAREGTLVAERFDLARHLLVGDVLSLTSPVQYSSLTGRTSFSTSRTGALVYQSHSDLAQLIWFDRSGREKGRIASEGDYLRVRISPEGQRVLFHRVDPRLGTTDLWTADLVRGVEIRQTSDPHGGIGVWLPNGRSVIFTGGRDGPPHLFHKDLETGIERELLPSRQRLQIPTDVSPDGRIVAFEQISERGDADLWTVPVDGSRPPAPLLASAFNERGLHFSPDGHFAAFTSDETGQGEIYVAPSTLVTAKRRVSSGGGSIGRWSPDGRELFYLAADGHVMAVPIRTTRALEIGVPVPLFAMQGRWPWRDFDVSPDGTRFLAVVPQTMANEQAVTAVMNWTAQVRR